MPSHFGHIPVTSEDKERLFQSRLQELPLRLLNGYAVGDEAEATEIFNKVQTVINTVAKHATMSPAEKVRVCRGIYTDLGDLSNNFTNTQRTSLERTFSSAGFRTTLPGTKAAAAVEVGVPPVASSGAGQVGDRRMWNGKRKRGCISAACLPAAVDEFEAYIKTIDLADPNRIFNAIKDFHAVVEDVSAAPEAVGEMMRFRSMAKAYFPVISAGQQTKLSELLDGAPRPGALKKKKQKGK